MLFSFHTELELDKEIFKLAVTKLKIYKCLLKMNITVFLKITPVYFRKLQELFEKIGKNVLLHKK